MRLSRLIAQQQAFWRQQLPSMRQRIDKWFLETRNGFRLQLVFLTAPVIVYPIGAFIINGPLIDKTFRRRYDVDTALPGHLQELFDKEYQNFLVNQGRKQTDSVVKFYVQNKYVDTDSIVKGTMSSKAGGARVALPFFVKFQSFDEAKEYCKRCLEPLRLFNSVACVIWDSDLGREIIETFVLSDNASLDRPLVILVFQAKRFIIYRDLISCENYQALVNAPVVVASYTIFSSFFTYVFNKYAFARNPTVLKFLLLYVCLTSMAVYGAIHYHKFYYFSTGHYADEETSKRSFEYTDGGMEYYRKLLRRHRLLRDVLDKGPDLFTPAGNLNGVSLNYVFRYGKLKDLIKQNDEVAPAFAGDDF